MSSTADVKSAHTAADAQLVSGPARLKSVYLVAGTGATNHCVFHNGTSASDPVLLELDTAHGGVVDVMIPGTGILFDSGIYVDTGDAQTVTIFYG